MKPNFFFFLFLSLTYNIFSQDLSWKNKIGGTGDAYSIRSEVDNKDNLYVIGYFANTINAGTSFSSKGGYDCYIAKFSKAGSLIWFKTFGGSGDDVAQSFAISNDSKNVYVLGYFSSTVNFGSDQLISTGGKDIFLANIDSAGNFAWTKAIGTGTTSNDQLPKTLTLDKNNNLFISGLFDNNIQLGSTVYSWNGFRNIFLAQYNILSQSFTWSKILKTKNSTSVIYNSTALSDGFALCGYYKDSLMLDIDTLVAPTDYFDVFFYKINYSGNGQFLRKISGAGDEKLTSITSDEHDNIYIGGFFNSTSLIIDSTNTITSKKQVTSKGGYDILFAKYDKSGDLTWVNTVGGSSDDYSFRALYRKSSFIVTGYYSGNVTFDNKTITSKGGTDVLGLIHDSNDNLKYLVTMGGTTNETGQASTITNDGNFIFVGDYYSNPFTAYAKTLANDGGRDVFIVAFDKGSLTKTVTPITCHGLSNGEISVYPEGTVVPPYTFQWTKKEGGFSSTSQTLNGLSAGTYRVTFTDAVGYTKKDSVVLTDPPALVVTERVHTNTKCYNSTDGVLKPRVTGGTGARTFVWTGTGAGLNASDSIQTALSAGTYNLTVTDGNECSTPLNNLVITEPGKIIFKGTVVTKINGSQGSVVLNVSGGTPAYGYVWTGPAGFTSVTTQNIANLTIAGDYKVVVTDQNTCKSDTTVLIADSHTLYAYISNHKNVSCKNGSDGSLTVTPNTNDSNPSFSYSWSGPGGFTASSATVNSLVIGFYSVTVTETAPVLRTYVVSNVEITQPSSALAVSISPGDITCYNFGNGFADANPTGGTLPYTYVWSKDGVGLSQTTEVLTGLTPGRYYVTVTDANNCQALYDALVSQPAQLVVSNAVMTPVTCYAGKNDGTISLSMAGGSPNYSYAWSNGLSSANITLLNAGTYRCTVTDAHNCKTTTLQTVSQPLELTASFSVTDVSCFGSSDGSVNMTPTGGNAGAYTYLWSTGATTEDISGRPGGTYNVTITDSKLCSVNLSTTVQEPADLVISTTSQVDVNCNGKSNGSLIVSRTGGTSPFNWIWSNGSAGSSVSGLTTGDYTVTLTDKNSCTKTKSFTITEPTPLVLSEVTASHVNVACNGGSTGSLTVAASGSSGTYQFSLNSTTWQSSGTFANISKGDYTVIVRDQSVPSCIQTLSPSIGITEPLAISFGTPVVTNTTCTGLSNGAISYSASGGTGTLAYTLKLNGTATGNTTGGSSGIFTGLAEGTGYTIEVTDDNFCGPVASASTDIVGPTGVSLSGFAAKDLTCSGINDGSIEAYASTQTGSVAYILKQNNSATSNTTGAANGKFTGLAPGTGYTIEMTDGSQCAPVSTVQIDITSPLPITITSELKNNTSSAGMSDGSLDVVATGGTGVLTYTLNSVSQSSGTFAGLPKGNYTVSVTDANSCGPVSSSVLTIEDPNGIGTIENLQVRFYPNPASDRTLIEIPDWKKKDITVEIRDITGKAAMAQSYKNVDNGFKDFIYVDKLPRGIYIVVINGKPLKDKLIVQ